VLTTGACAPESRQAENIQPVSAAQRVTLLQTVDVPFDKDSFTRLSEGSRWELLGTIRHGEVYKPVMQVPTVQGSHIHEPYIVVSGGRLVGFYTPFENTFSPLRKAVPLSLQVE
jgi:hypothetical protein